MFIKAGHFPGNLMPLENTFYGFTEARGRAMKHRKEMRPTLLGKHFRPKLPPWLSIWLLRGLGWTISKGHMISAVFWQNRPCIDIDISAHLGRYIDISIYRLTLDAAIAVSVALASSWELLKHFRTILRAFKSILGALQSRLGAYHILPFGAYRTACEIGLFDVLQVLLNLQYQLQILIDQGDIFDLEQP